MTKNTADIEESLDFTPRFDSQGLIPCIVSNSKTGEILMFAWMNTESLNLTLKTGEAHYWSRSRQELWHKGAISGNIQKIIEMRTDCDQDCLWIKVEVQNGAEEIACHTGRQSCFYREIALGQDAKSAQLRFKK